MDPEARWTSPSELADYAYCPRSHWYRGHPPSRGPSVLSTERSRAGVRYHRRVLTAERRRAERGTVYWAGILAGVALVVVGAVWFFRF
jgi:CRISPR/Cas system-associated exonuclease Cas4 (RecB family)